MSPGGRRFRASPPGLVGYFVCESDTTCSRPEFKGELPSMVDPSDVIGAVGDHLAFFRPDSVNANITTCSKAGMLAGACVPEVLAPAAPSPRRRGASPLIVAHDAEWLFYLDDKSRMVRIRL